MTKEENLSNLYKDLKLAIEKLHRVCNRYRRNPTEENFQKTLLAERQVNELEDRLEEVREERPIDDPWEAYEAYENQIDKEANSIQVYYDENDQPFRTQRK